MHVLHFFKTYWPDTFGGVERTIYAIARGVQSHDVESVVLSLSRFPKENSRSFDGHQALKAKLSFEFASTGFSREAVSKFHELSQQADIIHYHFPWPFMDMVHMWERPGKPCLVTYHSDIVKQKYLLKLYRPLMKAFLGSVDRIVVTSPNYLASSVQLEGFKHKTDIIPIGIDRDNYPEILPAKTAYWAERLPARFFLFIGVLRYYKGLHILLEAAAQTGYPIVIIGSGPLENDLKKQAESLGLTDCFFLGALPDEDKIALLDLAYCAVFPSHLRSEAFGLSLIEASMFAKPMISCEIGTGTSYVNKSGETGYVVPPNNPQAFAKAMTALWENPEEQKTMGAAALRRYQEHFTASRMAESYYKLYQKLLEQPLNRTGTVSDSVKG